MADLERRIYLTCPVRKATAEEIVFLNEYVAKAEQLGHKVYFPHRDTNQDDETGLYICMQNRAGIIWSNEIHIYWKPSSEGSIFDFGMFFMAERPLLIINKESVQKTPNKSFQNVLLELDHVYNLPRI